MKTFFWLALSFAVCSCSPASRDSALLNYAGDDTFLKWCAEFCESKSDEYLARIYPTWRENADYVQKSTLLPHSVSLNKFSHLSREEFSERYLSEVKPLHKVPSSSSTAVVGGDPPDAVDWRTKGLVPPVTDQGQCGSSVVFQVVHAVDSFHAIQTGALELASVEEYIDCCADGSCEGVAYDIGSYTCIVKIGGLALESVYNSPDHRCLNDTFESAVKISGGKKVEPSGSETALEVAVAAMPVAAAMDASHQSFQMYESGVYYEPDCSSTELDHVVLVVGYGKTGGQDYWICQNSWGSSWGMDGYFYLARNRGNNCGIATLATYPF